MLKEILIVVAISIINPKKNFIPNDNSESNKNGINTVCGDKKLELVAQKSEKPVAFQILCFYCKMVNS